VFEQFTKIFSAVQFKLEVTVARNYAGCKPVPNVLQVAMLEFGGLGNLYPPSELGMVRAGIHMANILVLEDEEQVRVLAVITATFFGYSSVAERPAALPPFAKR
jgi:hypothetical protein